MAGDILNQYIASSNLTVTNLHSLAASSSFTSGWTSGTIDNSTNEFDECHLTSQLTKAAANNQIGEIRIYVYTMLDDSNWPNLFSSGTEGTEGTCKLHDVEQLSAMVLVWETDTDASASDVHATPKIGLKQYFGGELPPKLAVYITGNAATSTNAQLAASGNQVTTAFVHKRYT